LIKELTYSFEERLKLSDALCNIKEALYNFKHGKTMSLAQYHELLVAQMVNHYNAMKIQGNAGKGTINLIGD
jgi:hypothetical protein